MWSTASTTTTPDASEAPAVGTAPLPTGGAELADTKWTLSGTAPDPDVPQRRVTATR